MASFIVICNACHSNFISSLADNAEVTNDEYEERVLFQTEHSINATESEIARVMICPRCDGVDCRKTFYGYNTISYIRGNGYLDVAGTRRDMNLFKLTEEDPYDEYRVPGEVEDMKVRLKRAGQHDAKTKHFAPESTVTTKDVSTAVSGLS